MASKVIRILNHEKRETHERGAGTTKRLPVGYSASNRAEALGEKQQLNAS